MDLIANGKNNNTECTKKIFLVLGASFGRRLA